MQLSTSQREMSAIVAELFPSRVSPIETLNRLRPLIMPVDQLVELVPPGSRVLDIGCGAGLYLGILAASGRIQHGVGFDSSEKAIALANRMRTRLRSEHDIKFLHLAVEDEWPEGLFDVVSLVDVMHHVAPAHQVGLLKSAAAKLRPGGRFIYKDMSIEPAWMATANRLHDLLIARDWINYLPIATVRETLHGMGFTGVREVRTSRLWYMHELLVTEAPR